MIVEQTVKKVVGHTYDGCTIKEVYSQTSKIGLREATNYYLRTDKGMVNLETGAFIQADAFTKANGLYRGLSFVHCPNAKVVL